MLGAAAAVLLCLLPPLRVNGLITTDAKCLPGYEWMYSTIGQSPCDIAAELASVCAPNGQFNLPPLPAGFSYTGPLPEAANICRCSSVYYSLLSGCGYCQGRDYVGWSAYNRNCSTVYVTTYNQQIPAGVRVPAYAYQNVSVSDRFDVTLAQSTKGAESSGAPSPTSSSSPPYTSTPSHSTNIPVIVGAVVGGLAGLGIIAALITFFVFRSRRAKQRGQKVQNYSSDLQKSPQMPFTPSTIAPLVPQTTSPPGSPGPIGGIGKVYDPDDPTTYPNVYDPYQQRTSVVNQTVTPNYTGNSAHQSMVQPQNSGGRPHFTGVPEL